MTSDCGRSGGCDCKVKWVDGRRIVEHGQHCVSWEEAVIRKLDKILELLNNKVDLAP